MFRRLALGIVLCLLSLTASHHLISIRRTPEPLATGTRPPADRPSARDAQAHDARRARIMLAQAPLTFEENRGQAGDDVRYVGRGAGYAVSLRPDRVTVTLPTAARAASPSVSTLTSASSSETPRPDHTDISIRLKNGRPPTRIRGVERQEAVSHYYRGADPSRWITDVPHVARVRYESVYPGIDVVFYGNQRRMEFDFVVAPRADVSAIGLDFDGVDAMRLEPTGDLVLQAAGGGELVQRAPVAYQDLDGQRHPVDARYVIEGESVRLDVGAYDRTQPLVIDPIFDYSTYLGAEANDNVIAVAVDSAGRLHVTGYTMMQSGFPAGSGSFGPQGNFDVYVTRFSSAGALLASTVIGGSLHDQVAALAVDATGAAYVVGETVSTNYPTTAGAYDTTANGVPDAFATKVALGGTLVYSTYLGAGQEDYGRGAAVTGAGELLLTGDTNSPLFPRTTGPTHQGAFDVFLTKLNASGTALVASVLLGGSANDHAEAMALYGNGDIAVAGETRSTNFPFPDDDAYDVSFNGVEDVFAARFDSSLSLIVTTLVGGCCEEKARGLAILGNETFLTGYTKSNDYPGLEGGTVAGSDVFVTKIGAGYLDLEFSSVFGGSGDDEGHDIAVGSDGYPYVVGDTASANFPVNGLDTSLGGTIDAFVVRLNFGGGLVYSSYLGGSLSDFGRATALQDTTLWVGGASFGDFPIVGSPYDGTFSSIPDGFIARFSDFNDGELQTLNVNRAGNGVVTSADGGITCGPSDCTEEYSYGTVVSLIATPDPGWSFAGWQGCDSTNANVCLVTMTRTRLVQATFVLTRTLTLFKGGASTGTVTSAPAGINCGPACSTAPASFAHGTTVVLTATPSVGAQVDGWIGCDSVNGATCTLTMNSNRTVTATFGPARYTGTLLKAGNGSGTVVVDPFGVTCDPQCVSLSDQFEHGTAVTLTATAAPGSTFTSWSGCDTVTGNVCAITITSPRTATATFTLLQQGPTITSLTPATGSTAGGTAVTITGQNLTGASVTIGGNAALNLVVQSSSLLTFLAPAHAPGAVTVQVNTPNGSASSSFTYVTPEETTVDDAARPAFSFDGRWMAFESNAALVPADTNGKPDIYVRDLADEDVVRISVSSTGAQALGGASRHPAISATGRFVAFESTATNLVPEDSNHATDIFLHDRDPDGNGQFDESTPAGAPRTFRVNLGPTSPEQPGGIQALGGDSHAPSISGSGRYVAFDSAATNLVATDTNGRRDVFVHDTLLGRTVRVSVSDSGEQSQNGDSRAADISSTGQFVAFQSGAVNLVANDTNTQIDVFRRDRDFDGNAIFDEAGASNGKTIRLNVSVVAGDGQAQGGASTEPSMSGDGTLIAFTSAATNMTTGDTNHVSDVFVRNLTTGNTTRMSLHPVSGLQFVGAAYAPALSANGNTLIYSVANIQTIPAGTAIVAFVTGGSETGGSVTIPGPGGGQEPGTGTGGGTLEPGEPGEEPGEAGVSGDGATTGSPVETPSGNTHIDVIDRGNEEEAGRNDPPYIAEITPSGGSQNITVEIRGDHFDPDATVLWGNQERALTIENERLARLTVPAGSGQVQCAVRSGGEVSNRVTFAYRATSTPRITSVTPPTGFTDGTSQITITGTGFVPAGIAVRFRGRDAQIVNATTTTLTVVAPFNVSGPSPIVVINQDGGEAGSNEQFVYRAPSVAATIVLDLSPAQGFRDTATVVTVRGAPRSFAPGTTATVDGRNAPVSFFSDTLIVLEVPPSARTGSVPVVISVPGTDSIDASFFYSSVPLPFPPPPAADTDGDGMTDNFEDAFGLNKNNASDAAGDPDGDGQTNVQEAQAQRHPVGLYTRYLAEGAANAFFNARVVVANPNTASATVLVHFQRDNVAPGESPTVILFTVVPGMGRIHVDPETIGVPAGSFATLVESDVEVAVDRSMFWDGFNYGSHAETSLASPASIWYLAEGATNNLFELFYLLQNPDLTRTADVRIRYLRSFGDPIELTYAVPPQGRRTIRVNSEHPELAFADISAVVTSENAVPIIVERAMYASFPGQRPFEAGHDSAGITAPSTEWFLAEGATGPFFDMFVLYANPDPIRDAAVETTYLLPDGTTITKNQVVAANRRLTVPVAGEDARLVNATPSVRIRSTNDVPIIVERTMWWPSGGPWIEAHNSPGSTATGTRWAVADGEVGPAPVNTQTFLLIGNTSNVTGQIRITLLFEDGSDPRSETFSVLPNSRRTIWVSPAGDFPNLGIKGFGALIESLPDGNTPAAQIVVERAMYSDSNGTVWGAGTNALATKLK